MEASRAAQQPVPIEAARAAEIASRVIDNVRSVIHAPDEVLRCEECRRILVRTPESGL